MEDFKKEEIQELINCGELKEVPAYGDGCSDKNGNTCFLFTSTCASYDCSDGSVLIEIEKQ